MDPPCWVARSAEGWLPRVWAAARDTPRPGVGGSAMPWGLVLPAARAKLVEGVCEPDVRLAALSYWLTRSVPLSTTQRWATFEGRRGIILRKRHVEAAVRTERQFGRRAPNARFGEDAQELTGLFTIRSQARPLVLQDLVRGFPLTANIEVAVRTERQPVRKVQPSQAC